MKNKKILIIIILVILLCVGVFGYFAYNKVNSREENSVGTCVDGGPCVIMYKPVIYLYSTKKQLVKIKLFLSGKITAIYPDFNTDNGWQIITYPNGKIVLNNRRYDYLFREGMEKYKFNFKRGFVVEGKNIKIFLEKILKKIGLTDKEANEFIVYWYPRMKNNKYNLIYFLTNKEVDKFSKLEITPRPDSMLRLLMIYKPLNERINIKPEQIKSFKRKGFTVVEWGGIEVK